MEQVSDKTIMFLLIAAIIISIGGTIVSINRLNQLIPRVTGLGTTTTGKVNVTLANVNSISITDSQIDFGSCSPNSSTGSNLSSNISNGTTWQSWGSPGVCVSIVNSPDNITIKNDGNTNLNISVKTNVIASTFIGGDSPYGPLFMFSVKNDSDSPGCNNATGTTWTAQKEFNIGRGMAWNWSNFTVADEDYLACANLTPVANRDSINLFVKLYIPADAPQKTDTNATLTFTATNW